MRTRHTSRELSVRDGFLLVTLVWVVLPFYAALPLLFVVHGISFTDAYFEAMSGLTATGATTLAGLDLLAPVGQHLALLPAADRRLGIMLLAVAVLPLLGLGGTQLYKAEMPGPMKEQCLTPRVPKRRAACGACISCCRWRVFWPTAGA